MTLDQYQEFIVYIVTAINCPKSQNPGVNKSFEM